MRDLNFQENTLNSKIAQVPTKEKLYRSIERQQTIKEQLYLFLLQQREEASISLAVTAPKAKIVDMAYSSKAPVTPNRTLTYLGALISGLLIPFIGLYVFFLLSTKVVNIYRARLGGVRNCGSRRLGERPRCGLDAS
jgi:uncharacterized protein involved in exopolysaccharide biosynthesis